MVNLFKNDSEVRKKRKKRQFDLGWGARSPKKLAQKLLAVAVCAAMVLLGVPLTSGRYVGSAADLPVVTLTLSKDATTGKYSLSGIEELDKHAGQKVRIKVECEGFETSSLGDNLFFYYTPTDNSGGWTLGNDYGTYKGEMLVPSLIESRNVNLSYGNNSPICELAPRHDALWFNYAGCVGGQHSWTTYGSVEIKNVLRVALGGFLSGPTQLSAAVAVRLGATEYRLGEADGLVKFVNIARSDLPVPMGDEELKLLDKDGNVLHSVKLAELGITNWPAAWERASWEHALGVDAVDKHGVLLYVTADGTTSTPVTGAAMQYLYDSAGVSGAAGSWFALDNSNGTFEEGSRFWLRWLVQGDEGFDEEIAKLDESVRASVDLSKVRMLVMGVDSPDGVPYTSWDEPVDFYVPVEDGWTEADVRARFLSSALDEDVSIRIEEYVFPGETAARRVAVLSLKHFSPYLVYDEVTEEERPLPDVSEPSPKTGDVVTAATVGGLGVVLVMALGVMLCLVVRRRNDMR